MWSQLTDPAGRVVAGVAGQPGSIRLLEEVLWIIVKPAGLCSDGI